MANYRKSTDELNQVLAALQALSTPNSACNEEMWPKTRHVAELCDINIYLSRYYLMKLVKDKKAYVSSRSINNSLRWYIAESAFPYEISPSKNTMRGLIHPAHKKLIPSGK